MFQVTYKLNNRNFSFVSMVKLISECGCIFGMGAVGSVYMHVKSVS